MNTEKNNTVRFITSVYFQDLFAKPLANFLIKLNVHPNLITLFGLLLSIFSALSFFYNNSFYGVVFFIIALILDSTDGRVARGLGKFSDLGKFLDNICDKIRSFVIVIPVVYVNVDSFENFFLLLVLYFTLPFIRAINSYWVLYKHEPTIYFWYKLPIINDFVRRNSLCGLYCGWERVIGCVVISPLFENFMFLFLTFVILEYILFLTGLILLLFSKDTNESYNF